MHREALQSDCVELPLFLFADPTDGTSVGTEAESEEIVLEVEEQGSTINLTLQSDLLLGEGGFGRVQRALYGKGYVAVKSSLPNHRAQDSMKTEISTLLQLNHPNIIKVLQHGHVLDPDHGRLPAYMMDLGRCSADALLETGWHNKAAAKAAQRDVGSALQHLHAAGLGHMDVKPGNWLVTNKFTAPDGETQLQLKLIDAGGAGRLHKGHVKSCTAEYAHPMQRGVSRLGPNVNVRKVVIKAFFDWYALRLSIFQLWNSDSDNGTATDEQILRKASETLASDKEFVLQAVQEGGKEVLFFVSETLLNDTEVVMEAIRHEGAKKVLFAYRALQSNKQIVMEAVKQNGLVLQDVSEALQNDKEVVMEAVRQKGLALQYASEKLRSDKEVVMEAFRQEGFALLYACDTFKKDKEIVMAAVRQHGCALECACEALQNDPELVMEAHHPDCPKRASKFYQGYIEGAKIAFRVAQGFKMVKSLAHRVDQWLISSCNW